MAFRCKICSGRLVLQEIAERTAHYKIKNDGTYEEPPIKSDEYFTFEVLCENGCDEPGFEFDRYVGQVVETKS